MACTKNWDMIYTGLSTNTIAVPWIKQAKTHMVYFVRFRHEKITVKRCNQGDLKANRKKD